MYIKTTHTAKIGATWDAAALRGTLCAADNVVLVAHMNADGDAVGSVTGAYSLLALHTGKTPTPLLPDGCPEDYLWLPNTDLILSGKDNPDQCADAIAKADLIICMDLNQMERTGRLADQLKAASAKKILIDHHENPAQDAFDIIVSDPDISSTCELAFWLFRDLFGPQPFPADAATSLFTGMCTDTGTFAYSNRDASLYLAAAGVGTIGIVDADNVDLSNLQRQVIHFTKDVGKPKVESAKEKMLAINPDIKVNAIKEFLFSDNALDIIKDYDFAIAGMLGTIQAAEALKYILGIGNLLTNRLLTFDAKTMEFRTIPVKHRDSCPICGSHPTIDHLIDYEQKACDLPNHK